MPQATVLGKKNIYRIRDLEYTNLLGNAAIDSKEILF